MPVFERGKFSLKGLGGHFSRMTDEVSDGHQIVRETHFLCAKLRKEKRICCRSICCFASLDTKRNKGATKIIYKANFMYSFGFFRRTGSKVKSRSIVGAFRVLLVKRKLQAVWP